MRVLIFEMLVYLPINVTVCRAGETGQEEVSCEQRRIHVTAQRLFELLHINSNAY